jgi:hypothetical protein
MSVATAGPKAVVRRRCRQLYGRSSGPAGRFRLAALRPPSYISRERREAAALSPSAGAVRGTVFGH